MGAENFRQRGQPVQNSVGGRGRAHGTYEKLMGNMVAKVKDRELKGKHQDEAQRCLFSQPGRPCTFSFLSASLVSSSKRNGRPQRTLNQGGHPQGSKPQIKESHGGCGVSVFCRREQFQVNGACGNLTYCHAGPHQ